MIEQQVGVITDTFLGHESHGIFTFVLDIDTDTSYDVLGTICLSYRPNGDTDRYNPLIGEAIGKICAAVTDGLRRNRPGDDERTVSTGHLALPSLRRHPNYRRLAQFLIAASAGPPLQILRKPIDPRYPVERRVRADRNVVAV